MGEPQRVSEELGLGAATVVVNEFLLLEEAVARYEEIVNAPPNPDLQFEMLKRLLEDGFEKKDEELRAVASAMRRLTDGLSSAENQRRASYQEIKDALVSILGVSGETLSLQRDDLSKMSAEELANLIEHPVVCAIRDIQWKRGESNRPLAPLPPLPNGELVATAAEDSDDSMVFKTQKDGSVRIKASIKAKTLFGWLVALIIASLYVYEKIKPYLHK